jgi:hypothetical protein
LNLLQTLLLNLPIALASWSLARRIRVDRGRLDAALAAAVLAWGWVTAGVLLLGTTGTLSLPFALGWAAIAGLAVLAARIGKRGQAPGPRKRFLAFAADSKTGGQSPFSSLAGNPDGNRLEPKDRFGPLAWIAFGALVLTAMPLAANSFVWPVKVVSDGPIYHLYFAVRWWKAGRVFLVPTPFGETAAPYFPANGDLWFTWLTLGWGGDRLARIGQLPFLILAGLATFGIARRLGASASAALVATTLFLSCNPLLLFTFEPNVDTIFVAGYLLSAYFLTRVWQGDSDRMTVVLAGLSAGLAWGTKPTGTVFVPLLLAFGSLAIWNHGEPRRFRRILILLAATAAGCGFWYARNALLTGNPLYPLQVAIFGRTVLTGWYGSDAMKTSPYYIPVSDWRAFLDIFLGVVDFRLAPFWGLAILGLRRRGSLKSENRIAQALFALGILNVAAYWFLLPYRTQQRFMLQGLGLFAVPLARFLDRGWFWRLAAVVALIVHLTTWQAGPFPHDFSPQVPSDLPPLFSWTSYQGILGTSNGTLFVLGLSAISREKRWLRCLGAGFLTFSLTLNFLGAWQAQRQTRIRPLATYPQFADYLPGWIALEGRTGTGGARIAYAGTNLPYYLMGKGLRNEVRYVSIDGHRDWLLHDYHRRSIGQGRPNWPGTRPGWDRVHPDFEAWLANLEAQGIQILVVARANPLEGSYNLADAEGFPIERVWADAHPEFFTLLYGDDPPDPLFRFYRVHSLSPKKSSGNRTDSPTRPHY